MSWLRPRGGNRMMATLCCVATLGVFGPHLLILGYKAAGIRPPATLVFFCLLHHGAYGSSSKGTAETHEVPASETSWLRPGGAQARPFTGR
jgi:hypothetical protein